MANKNENNEAEHEKPIQVWGDWLDRWCAQRVEDAPADEATSSGRSVPPFVVALIAAGVIIVAVMVVAVSQLTSTEEPDPFAAAQLPTPTVGAPSEDGPSSTAPTSSAATTPQCDETDTGDTLTTSSGGEVTSPQTLVAEFQHRYFDLRDGSAVAELWDDGYEAEGFQATIDDSLAELKGRASWCLTVAPAESGWWSTEVSWWQQGDQKVRETWYGTYKIERRGSGYIFTDAATE